MDVPQTDDEIIGLVLKNLYNDGKYKEFHLWPFLTSQGIMLNGRDYNIFKNKLVRTHFVEMETDLSIDLFGCETGLISLTDKGILAIKEHGNYSSYLAYNIKYQKALLKKNRKLERAERNESWPKRHWFIVAVFTFVFGGILGPLIVEIGKKKILEEPTQSTPSTQAAKDSTKKTAVLPLLK